MNWDPLSITQLNIPKMLIRKLLYQFHIYHFFGSQIPRILVSSLPFSHITYCILFFFENRPEFKRVIALCLQVGLSNYPHEHSYSCMERMWCVCVHVCGLQLGGLTNEKTFLQVAVNYSYCTVFAWLGVCGVAATTTFVIHIWEPSQIVSCQIRQQLSLSLYVHMLVVDFKLSHTNCMCNIHSKYSIFQTLYSFTSHVEWRPLTSLKGSRLRRASVIYTDWN